MTYKQFCISPHRAVMQHGGSFGASEVVANHNAPILDCNAPTPNFDMSGDCADFSPALCVDLTCLLAAPLEVAP